MDNGQHEENSLIKSSVQYGQTDTKSSSKPEEEKEEELSGKSNEDRSWNHDGSSIKKTSTLKSLTRT